MIDPVPAELNLNNLRDIFARISHIDAFIFFGTLLGYQREGNIIAHDDDIDIYVNEKDHDLLIEALSDSGFEFVRYPKRKRQPICVLQARRMQDNIKTYADFYFYTDAAEGYLLEKWNFKGDWRNEHNHLHIPKKLIYPLQAAKMQGIEIKIPSNPKEVCRFLYGDKWNIPIKKDDDYNMNIINNVPVFTQGEPKKP